MNAGATAPTPAHPPIAHARAFAILIAIALLRRGVAALRGRWLFLGIGAAFHIGIAVTRS